MQIVSWWRQNVNGGPNPRFFLGGWGISVRGEITEWGIRSGWFKFIYFKWSTYLYFQEKTYKKRHSVSIDYQYKIKLKKKKIIFLGPSSSLTSVSSFRRNSNPFGQNHDLVNSSTTSTKSFGQAHDLVNSSTTSMSTTSTQSSCRRTSTSSSSSSGPSPPASECRGSPDGCGLQVPAWNSSVLFSN